MKLHDGMLLFHGSYTAIEKIDLNQCMWGKDFGKGFYLSSDPVQARNFIKSSVIKAQNNGSISLKQNYGFVSYFRYHETTEILRIYQFQQADKDWLWFIAQNRRRSLAKSLISLIF